MSDKIQNINEIASINTHREGAADTPLEAEYNQGKALLEKGETAAAAVALHNALIGFEEKHDEKGMANALSQLGLACIQRGDTDKALAHLQRAEEICRGLGDPMSLIWLAKQFIVVYTAAEQYKEAINRCLDLLDHYKANNDPKGSVEILEKIAEIYIQSGEKTKAADAYTTIASIHRNFKHVKIAESYLEKAEKLGQEG
jgi:tetratricopeptide (TPR) repeat protein